MGQLHDPGFEPDDLTVRISELLVATADSGDALINSSVQEVLQLLRERLKMDVVFVSEFVNGQRVFRQLDSRLGRNGPKVGDSDPLEETFCQAVVDGRMPGMVPDVEVLRTQVELPPTGKGIGAFLSTPIVMKDGSVYGTLCCFSMSPNPSLKERDLQNLKFSAKLTAQKIEEQNARRSDPPPDQWALEPIKPVKPL